MRLSILFIVPATYEALKEKGVENMVFERDEGGFFEKVITVHPLCPETQTIILNDCHEIYEVGFDLIPGSKRFRFLRCIQYPIHFFRIIWSTLGLVKKYRIDIIRATDPYWMGLIAYTCARICKTPFCISIHADYDQRMRLDKNISVSTVFGSYKLAKLLERFILSKANKVMPIRETLAVKAAAKGAAAEKIRVIPHGMDLTVFHSLPRNNIRQLFNIDPDKKIISFVGRLSKDNYVDDILEIAKQLGNRRKDFLIIMAGGGKEEHQIKAKVASNVVLKKHILLTGFQPRDVCIDLRRTSDVSLCLMAGFSLIEACAAECPVVSYDIEWHSELVKNKETGFLVKEHDVDSVVDALDWLLNHPIESKAMGQKAKALAFKRHELKESSAIKVSCYSEILSQGLNH
jgi:glycosyltransferase involved in cell wall biosynthesis